jgi:hypothetical protein
MKYDQTLEQVMAREAQARLLARACGGDGEEILALAYHALVDANYDKEAQRLLDLMDELYE